MARRVSMRVGVPAGSRRQSAATLPGDGCHVQNDQRSARVSYEFYSLFFPGRYAPKLARMKGRAPLAWDLDGGPRAADAAKLGPSPDENHGPKGGNVLFADGHAEWKDVGEWFSESWPQPAPEFYPKP